nr:uncharacterized protein LOC109164907 [Ipomoea batatas]
MFEDGCGWCENCGGNRPFSAPGSPLNKIKFMCSHGGKILLRGGDSHLKYAGGETRVISVPRDIKLEELMKKLTYPIEGGDMVLKYQIFPEDLDALVSVKSDEDLRHMMEEHERCEAAGAPKLRAFLFPAKPVVLDHHGNPRAAEALEQCYVDAINGKPLPSKTVFSVSSACSPPTSPESCTNDAPNHDQVMINVSYSMHKVQSMPSIYNIGGQPQSSSSHYIPAHQQFSHQHHLHPYYYNSRQQMYQGNQSAKLPFDLPRGSERLISVRSANRVDGTSHQADHNPHYNNYYSPSRHSRGSGCTRCLAPFDDCRQFYNRCDRAAGGPSPSPLIL